jgi:hypothetical protein
MEFAMNPPFEKTLIEVWRQALVENATTVELDATVIQSGGLRSAACGR